MPGKNLWNFHSCLHIGLADCGSCFKKALTSAAQNSTFVAGLLKKKSIIKITDLLELSSATVCRVQ